VAIGLPPAAGLAIYDDFFVPVNQATSGADVRYGDLKWKDFSVSGGVNTFAGATPDDWAHCGILQGTTPAIAGRGETLALDTVPALYRFPPPGSVWAVKFRITSGTVNYELWSGFASGQAVRVSAVDATSSFLGVLSVGDNLFGTAKSGAATSTVDLGVSAEGTWRCVGFEVGGTTAAPEVQFFRLDPLASNRAKWDRLDVGAPITTNLPAVPTYPIAMGILTTSAAAKIAQIDWWSLGGRAARG
jgi:hypothetical protein